MNNSILKITFLTFIVICLSISCKKEQDNVIVANYNSSGTEKSGLISAINNSTQQQIEFTNTQVNTINNRVILSTQFYGGIMSFSLDLSMGLYSLTPSFSNTSIKLCKEYDNNLLEICVPELGSPQEFTPTQFDILVHDKTARRIEGVFKMGILYTEKSGDDDHYLIEMNDGAFVIEY
jgi:hypothetical protein